MVTTGAVLRGDRARLLAFDPAEQPVALQLGGADPAALAAAARIGEDFGYAEINLNVGCPSDRVQEGRFGACLMAEPALVGDCVAGMKAAVGIPVTVKCRLGIDDQDEAALDAMAASVDEAGADALIVHARKAWLHGLSPKENRDIPPLDYARVHRLKAAHPDFTVVLNGGIRSVEAGLAHIASAPLHGEEAQRAVPNHGPQCNVPILRDATLRAAPQATLRAAPQDEAAPGRAPALDGVMMGRAAYQEPWRLLAVDPLVFGEPAPFASPRAAAEALVPYLERETARGTRPYAILRHVLGLFHAVPGARAFRRHLAVHGVRADASAQVLRDALALVVDTAAELPHTAAA
jgi:tRNA-dihydrouridine synthase A